MEHRRPVYHLYQMAWTALDWLYPPRCGGCGQGRERWCAACDAAVQVLPDTVCDCCGKIYQAGGLCKNCRAHPPAFKALRAWGAFRGPLRQALHRLKYERDIALGEILSRRLIDMLRHLQWQIDIITLVPIGVARQAERGYNQATFLALPVALALGQPFRPKALSKVRETPSQVGLSMEQRKINVEGAFRAQEQTVAGKSILVIDDVTTTGATLQACAEALVQSGARHVFGLTMARAI